jgi:hypothetical protein
MIIVEKNVDNYSTAMDIFGAALSDPEDFTGGIAVEGTSYLALFTISEIDEGMYSVTDFLIDGDSGKLLAVDEEMSETYTMEDTLSVITNRLSQIED